MEATEVSVQFSDFRMLEDYVNARNLFNPLNQFNMMQDLIERWLSSDGPSAITLREYLIPAEGRDAIFYPPTFAPPEEEKTTKSVYVKDEHTYLIDSVESQANRMELIFLGRKDLVPQITIKVKRKKEEEKEKEKAVKECEGKEEKKEKKEYEFNLLQLGHRAADALVRFSEDREKFEKAFVAYRDNGNAELLAKRAPTSLIFGAWDSRCTQTKVPRIVRSEIRAFNADPVSRAAQYSPPLDYVREEILPEELLEKKIKEKKLGSIEGFYPATTHLHGGIILRPDGFIRRDASLSLVLIRLLKGENPERTSILQRYILGLALLSLFSVQDYYLRQWCQLVLDREKPREVYEVYKTGERVRISLDLRKIEEFAHDAARKFGVGESFSTRFIGENAVEKLEEKLQQKTRPSAGAGAGGGS